MKCAIQYMLPMNRVVTVGILGALFAIIMPFASHAATVDSTAVSAKVSHHAGIDIRPGYVAPSNGFIRGNNEQGKTVSSALSAHLKYSFSFTDATRMGRLYPGVSQGIGVAYTSFFTPSLLGDPLSVYAFQSAPIYSFSSRLSLGYEWNFGASFGWKAYDESSHSMNSAIGSKVNAYLNLGIVLRYRLDDRFTLVGGIEGSHYSNGNTQLPNAGVNTIGARVGVVYNFGGRTPSQLASVEVDEPMPRHFSYDLMIYCATRKKLYTDAWGEQDVAPGNFGVVGLNFAPMYNVNRYFRGGISLDAQYDESANLQEYLVDGTSGDDVKFYRQPFSKRFSAGLSLRAELVMPVFSVNVGIGRNIVSGGPDTSIFYQVLALKVRLPQSFFLHIGYQLSDFSDPNNLMLGIGYTFGNKR